MPAPELAEDTIDVIDDEFAAAFAGEPSTEKKPQEAPPAEEPDEKEEAPEPDKKEEPPAEEEAPPGEKEEPAKAPVEKPVKEEPPAPPKEQPPAPKEQPFAAPKEQPKEEPKPEAKEEPPSAEEEKALKDFKADWPEVAKAVELIEQRMEKRFAATVEKRVQEVLAKIAPLESVAVETAHDKLIRAVSEVHPDWKTQMPALEAWIDKQPKFLQPAYNATLDSGGAQDVVALFDMFKQSSGLSGEAPAKPAPKKEDPEKQKRLDSMAAVPAARSSAKTEDDPNDFEGAFRQASKK